MLHSMNRLASILCVLACLGCADEFPPLVPYVDLGPRPGSADDMATSPGVDKGTRLDYRASLDLGRDGSMHADMAFADDMDDLDVTSMFDWGVFDMAPLDGGQFDIGVDDMKLDDGLDDGADDTGSSDVAPPDLDPLDQSPPEPDLRPPLPDMQTPVREVCNSLDDDADGRTDEEPNCGRVIIERCRVFLGFHDYWGAPGVSDSYGGCPEELTDPVGLGDVGCVGTLHNPQFRRITTTGLNVNSNDEVAIAFICDDDAIGRWHETHCEVLFGQGDSRQGDQPESRDEWAAAPGQDPDKFISVGTGGDGRFHAIGLLGDVGDDDVFAVAFRCHDEMQPERAASAQAAVNVILGWADSDGGPDDQAEQWMPGCPAPDGTALAAGDGIGCAGSNFDGRFYRIDLSGNVDGNDVLGIALIPRPPPRDAQPRP